jgi:hypothetical protein
MHVHRDFSTLGNCQHLKKSVGNNFWSSGQLPNGLPGYATEKHIEIHNIKLLNFIYKYDLNKKSYGCVWKLFLK